MKLAAQMNGSQCTLTCSRFLTAVIAPVMILVMPKPRIKPIGTESNWNSTMSLCAGVGWFSFLQLSILHPSCRRVCEGLTATGARYGTADTNLGLG